MTINLDKIKSRKLWVTIGVGLLTSLNTKFTLGIPADALTNLVYLAMAYVGGQSLVDMKKGQ